MNEKMNEWMKEWMIEWMTERMNEWMSDLMSDMKLGYYPDFYQGHDYFIFGNNNKIWKKILDIDALKRCIGIIAVFT